MVKLLKIKMILLKLKIIQHYFFGVGNILFNSEDGSQSYLIFQPLYRYFKTATNTNYTPKLSYVDYRIRVKFTGSCLKQSKITYTHKKG